MKTYETPEVIELGKAETLTLGSNFCGHDAVGCELAAPAGAIF